MTSVLFSRQPLRLGKHRPLFACPRSQSIYSIAGVKPIGVEFDRTCLALKRTYAARPNLQLQATPS